MKKQSAAIRFHRWLLRIYPRRFREVYGRDLDQVFRLRLANNRSGWFRFWVETLVDLLWGALAARFQRSLSSAPTPPRGTFFAYLGRDVQMALRMVRKQPGFAVVVVFTLAIGIGANTALFSVLHGVLLTPLPYDDPGQLVRVWERDTNEGTDRGNMSPADYFDYKAQNGTLRSFGAFSAGSAVWRWESEAERVPIQVFTSEVFDILGVPAFIGRTFGPDDEVQSDGRVAVLSYGFWEQNFGADSSVLGNNMRLGSNSYEIIGVMPASFRSFSGTTTLWIPWQFDESDRTVRRVHYVRTIGRLRADASLEDARADLLTIARRLELDYPDDNAGHLVTVLSLEESIVGSVRSGLWLLMAAVGFVLLIACANLANLLLTRGVGRQPELALRAALGAPRGVLVRQLVTENMVLALIGAAAGVGVAFLGVKLFLALDPGTLPRIDEVGVRGPSLAFAIVIAVGTSLLFGLGPSIVLSRGDNAGVLKDTHRATQGAGMRRMRDASVIFQLALAITLLVGAGLLLRSFDRLQQVDPGFNSSGLLAAQLSLPGSRYPNDDDVVRFQNDLFSRLEASPDIHHAGSVTFLPFTGESSTAWLNIVGRTPWDGIPPEVNIINVSGSSYFRAMGVPLLAGRMFDARDRANAPRVTLINQTAANQFWPNEDPIGQRIRLGPNPEAEPFEIIGVVGDIRQFGLDEAPFPASFSLSAQVAWYGFFVVAMTDNDPMASVTYVRNQVRALDPQLVISDFTTMDGLIDASVARPRFASWLITAFSLVALCIATVGVYGVIAYSVAQRTQEIGVRMALGAGKWRVLKLVLRHGLALAFAGLALGLVVAAVASRLVRNLLFEVSALDPFTFVAVPIVLAGSSFLACYLPAARAARLDPVTALKAD